MSQMNSRQSMAPQRAYGVRLLLVGLVLAAAGAWAASAWAQEPGATPPAHARHGMHGARGGGAMGGPGHLFMGRPEQIDRAVDRWLEGVNASDAQRGQVKEIARAAAVDLRVQHEAGRGLREQGMKLFAAPVVDARAVEGLRQQRLAQHDQASKRVSQAMLDIAAVLTPEQRAQLAQRMEQRQQHMKDRMQRAQERRAAASNPAR